LQVNILLIAKKRVFVTKKEEIKLVLNGDFTVAAYCIHRKIDKNVVWHSKAKDSFMLDL
jgi:hypothetical protein